LGQMMNKIMKYLFGVLVGVLLGSVCQAKDYPYRWVFVSKSLRADSDVAAIKTIVRTASEHGLNGLVLSAGLDRLDLQKPDYFAKLRQVKQICSEHNVEIIPIIFSAGYGGSVISHDRNLAAGIPVKDALFVVENGKAHLVPDPPVKIANGGFEKYSENRMAEYRFHDKPGAVSFVDREVFKSGKASLRFENFGKYEHGHARVMQEIKVKPYRCYRLSCLVRTEKLEPRGSLRMLALSLDGRSLAPWDPSVPATADWRKVVMGFNSLDNNRVMVYVGVWGGKSGRFWVDDFKVEEVALLNVLRRPGTPVTVRSEKTQVVYEQGKDYAAVKDEKLTFRFDHEPPLIEIPQESRIKDSERLRVSYYHGMAINRGQVSICMSEPKVYEIWAEQARLIHKHLAPNKYLLSMDEVRAGGTCRACKKRKITMGRMLGDCITKQVNMIREVNPDAEVLVWSDMLDPNHNAHDNYYLVDGDFAGSWKHVPKDLVIVCWYHKKRSESLGFFSSLGFRTMAGAYYDGDTLENPSDWLEALDKTPKAMGIMYTTWQNKYELLGPFGDLVTKKVDE